MQRGQGYGMNSIFHRISVRKYQNRDVEQEKIKLMLKAAMAAPSDPMATRPIISTPPAI